MPDKNKKIAIYIGVFDASNNTFSWKKTETFTTFTSGYKSFKALCKKCVDYSYDDLMKIYSSPRLDIELRQGPKKMLKWFGVYEKEDISDEE